MTIPLSRIPISSIRGDNEGVTSLAMPRVFGSGSQNLWLDQHSRASNVADLQTQNGTKVTTTAGSDTVCRGLTPYNYVTGGVTTRQVIGSFDDEVNEWEIHSSADLGVTWTRRLLDAPSFGAIPDFASLGTTLAITNGIMTPKLWDGATVTTAGGIQLAAPVATTSAVAGLLDGSYRYRIVPIRSTGARKIGSIASNTVQVQKFQVGLTWTADADVTVVGYEVYRTLGTNAVFFFVEYVDGRLTIAYTDNTADSALRGSRQLQEFGDAPPSGAYFCEEHKKRMWYGRTTAFPRGWFPSDPGLVDSVYAENKLDCTADARDTADISTGATGDFNGMMAIWLEHSVWTVSGTGEVNGAIIDWTLRRTDAKQGTVSHRTVARIPPGAHYTDERGEENTLGTEMLAYLTPVGDIRLFDGTSDTIISTPVATTLRFAMETVYGTRRQSFVTVDEVRGEVTWTVVGSGYVFTWNYRHGVWYRRPAWALLGSSTVVDSSSSSNIILAGTGTFSFPGLVYSLWKPNAYSSTYTLELKTLYGHDFSVYGQPRELLMEDKRWRQADILILVDTTSVPITFVCEYSSGEVADGFVAIGTETIVLPLAAKLSNVIRMQFQDANGHYLVSRGMKLRIKSTAPQIAFSIVGLDIAYQLLPGVNRDFDR